MRQPRQTNNLSLEFPMLQGFVGKIVFAALAGVAAEMGRRAARGLAEELRTPPRRVRTGETRRAGSPKTSWLFRRRSSGRNASKMAKPVRYAAKSNGARVAFHPALPTRIEPEKDKGLLS
jgi:hypothetical protein